MLYLDATDLSVAKFRGWIGTLEDGDIGFGMCCLRGDTGAKGLDRDFLRLVEEKGVYRDLSCTLYSREPR